MRVRLASRFACTGSQLYLAIGYGSKKSCATTGSVGSRIGGSMATGQRIVVQPLALLAAKKNEYTPCIQNVYRHEKTKLVNWKYLALLAVKRMSTPSPYKMCTDVRTQSS